MNLWCKASNLHGDAYIKAHRVHCINIHPRLQQGSYTRLVAAPGRQVQGSFLTLHNTQKHMNVGK